MGVLSLLAGSLGMPEAGVKLMLSVFAGYPCAIAHRHFFFKKDRKLQHVYMAAVGGLIMLASYGYGILHSIMAILVAWFLCNFMAGTVFSVIVAFVGFMVSGTICDSQSRIVFRMSVEIVEQGHLLIGYWVTETENYDINWTMPHCVLTLRLIGLVWDHYDGAQKVEELTPERKETAIRDPPSILETFAFCYFYGSFLVGPQLPLSQFREFVDGKFCDQRTGGPPNTIRPMAERLLMGIVFLVIFVASEPFFPNSMFQSAAWLNGGLLYKHFTSIVWFQIKFLSYGAAWMITEGICILSGVSYNGLDADGKAQWDGLRNFRLHIFYGGCSVQSNVEGFNVNTNKWAAKYVFKRLKFLGNKELSQACTLAFLASWHGWHLGYFSCFIGEFLLITGERQLVSIVKRVGWLDNLLRTTLWPLTWMACKTFMVGSVTFFLISFGLIKKTKWIPVYNALYWDGYLFFLIIWPITFQILKRVVPKPRPAADSEKKVD